MCYFVWIDISITHPQLDISLVSEQPPGSNAAKSSSTLPGGLAMLCQVYIPAYSSVIDTKSLMRVRGHCRKLCSQVYKSCIKAEVLFYILSFVTK